MVLFHDFPLWREQAVRQVTIGSEKQQARTVFVQSSHRHAPDFLKPQRQKIHHCFLMAVPRGGKDIQGLVHHHMAVKPGVQSHIVYLYLAAFFRLGTGIPTNLEINSNLAASYQLPGFIPGEPGGLAYQPVKPHWKRRLPPAF
jgi:hypothetical protein